MTTATKAGGAVLPVVGWRADDHSSPHVALTPEGLGLVGKRYSYALTPHAPAQAIIDAQAAEIERLQALEPTSRAGAVLGQMKSELDAARAELSTLKAKQVADATYDTNNGPAAPEAMAAFQANLTKPRGYVVRPVADIDEVMRLADAMAKWEIERYGSFGKKHYDAAREALRAALTKDRT